MNSPDTVAVPVTTLNNIAVFLNRVPTQNAQEAQALRMTIQEVQVSLQELESGQMELPLEEETPEDV